MPQKIKSLISTFIKKPTIFAVLFGVCGGAFSQGVPTDGFINVRNFKAMADGRTKCTEAIRNAISAATARGGGTVFFPAGVYLTGPIRLQSHVTLYLDSGATLKFSDDFNDYLPYVPSRWEGIEVENFSPLIYADGAEDIAICGRGRIDGQGAKWWSTIKKITEDDKAGGKEINPWQKMFRERNQAIIRSAKYELLDRGFLRPPLFQVRNCTNVVIDGVTLANPPFWTVNPVYCERVTIHGIIINNPSDSPNTDGINAESCRDVHISDCYINSGDDCITIKSGRDADGRRVGRPAENYTIVNCTTARGHGGVVIGSEMSGGVQNISIANCVFDGTDRGIRIKSMRGRGSYVENVRVSNITLHHILHEGILVTLYYKQSEPEPFNERTPAFRDISISGVSGDAKIAAAVLGLPESPIRNLRLSDCLLNSETGFEIADAIGIELHDLTINPTKGTALRIQNVDGLDLAGFKTALPHVESPVIDLHTSKHIFVHDCDAAPGTGVFLSVDAASTNELALGANDFRLAKTPVKKLTAIP